MKVQTPKLVSDEFLDPAVINLSLSYSPSIRWAFTFHTLKAFRP